MISTLLLFGSGMPAMTKVARITDYKVGFLKFRSPVELQYVIPLVLQVPSVYTAYFPYSEPYSDSYSNH